MEFNATKSLAEAAIPWFGARAMAADLQAEVRGLNRQLAEANERLRATGALTAAELQALCMKLQGDVDAQRIALAKEKADADAALDQAKAQLRDAQKAIVATEDVALLQEAGIYSYRHPLTDVVAYENRLHELEDSIKEMARRDGGAVLATTSWRVNDSLAAGRAMVRDFSKLLLRVFNAGIEPISSGWERSPL